MARANRHFIPGQVWHITQRCHKRDFLLKLVKDRRGLTKWLHEAKLRYGLVIFNYIVTSNHVHLLLLDESGQEVIPRSMQLIAGRAGQEYNQRKRRKGAFWEDRYHATAIEEEKHLLRCLVYIDLNMVRAGVVKHPSEWPFSGYHEIQSPKRKCAIISYKKLAEKAGFKSYEAFSKVHKEWVNEALSNANGFKRRQSEWTESIAVGSETFTLWIKERLVSRAKGRTNIESSGDTYQLRKSKPVYIDDFYPQKEPIGDKNSYLWETY